MIIPRKVGNITIFSFNENEDLFEDIVPFDAAAIILDVSVTSVAGQTYTMEKKEIRLSSRPMCRTPFPPL